jgi:pyruvate-ferredoxin/flavodoxin oxidoreductase
MAFGTEQQKLAVDSGVWPLYRFDPRRTGAERPLVLDSGAPRIPVSKFRENEGRFRLLAAHGSDHAKTVAAAAQREAERQYRFYASLAGLTADGSPASPEPAAPKPGEGGAS